MAYEEERINKHLVELKGSDFQIVEGEPDITGWDVIDTEGRKIGEVEDVLFDPQSRSVRYIIIDLGENELELDTDRKVLAPIGIAELPEQSGAEEINEESVVADEEYGDEDDYDDEVVYLPGITAAQLTALPAYQKDKLTPEDEVAIRSVFEPRVGDAVIVYERSSFYAHEHFNNKLLPPHRDDLSDEAARDNDAPGADRY